MLLATWLKDVNTSLKRYEKKPLPNATVQYLTDVFESVDSSLPVDSVEANGP